VGRIYWHALTSSTDCVYSISGMFGHSGHVAIYETLDMWLGFGRDVHSVSWKFYRRQQQFGWKTLIPTVNYRQVIPPINPQNLNLQKHTPRVLLISNIFRILIVLNIRLPFLTIFLAVHYGHLNNLNAKPFVSKMAWTLGDSSSRNSFYLIFF
jgi:hypothetical protein